MRGLSLRRPNLRPAKYAPVSAAQTMASAVNNQMWPFGCCAWISTSAHHAGMTAKVPAASLATRAGVVVGTEIVGAQPQRREQPPRDADHGATWNSTSDPPLAVREAQTIATISSRFSASSSVRARGVLDLGQAQPFPQATEEQHRGEQRQPWRGQEQDRGDRQRRHYQGGQQAGAGHAWFSSVEATWPPVRPKRRSRPAKSSSARCSVAASRSGHNVSVNHNSA